mmetsp:Transcript_132635/g.424424  ORF Transcript_132635/g.424424 Transcript_132635/m.424424 type:complete len:262 (+) Transcript_132635:56-841(+)
MADATAVGLALAVAGVVLRRLRAHLALPAASAAALGAAAARRRSRSRGACGGRRRCRGLGGRRCWWHRRAKALWMPAVTFRSAGGPLVGCGAWCCLGLAPSWRLDGCCAGLDCWARCCSVRGAWQCRRRKGAWIPCSGTVPAPTAEPSSAGGGERHPRRIRRRRALCQRSHVCQGRFRRPDRRGRLCGGWHLCDAAVIATAAAAIAAANDDDDKFVVVAASAAFVAEATRRVPGCIAGGEGGRRTEARGRGRGGEAEAAER